MWKCPGCGADVEDNFDLCWNCGNSKSGEGEHSAFSGPAESEEPEAEGAAEEVPEWLAAIRRSDESDRGRGIPYGKTRAHNYLTEAILVTIFCCLPFGIVAIAFAAQVNGHLAAGNYHAAASASSNARMWCWASFWCGLAAGVIWFFALFADQL